MGGKHTDKKAFMRIRFTRGEEVKFISHLDLMRVFERAVRRSNLPVAYSQGFNPHPGIVFGLPLAVGVASRGEYADFELERETEPEFFMKKLNETLPEAIRVVKAGLKESKVNIMSSISAAEYTLEIFLKEPMTPEDASERLKTLLRTDSVRVLKESRNKRGETVAGEVEIRPMILDAELAAIPGIPPGYEEYKAAFEIRAKFKAGSKANLRPELFISALKEYGGIAVDSCRICRENLYSEINGKLVDPLDESVLSYK
ncbi:MAG: TIGR03936 family radical SAM-associated protein [Bacillota bacterium]